jgi:hypothetical protein
VHTQLTLPRLGWRQRRKHGLDYGLQVEDGLARVALVRGLYRSGGRFMHAF